MSKPSTDARGRRYSIAEKAATLEFIAQFNRMNGQGGQRAASQKFGIAQLSLKNWMRHGSVSRKTGPRTADRTGETLNRLQALHDRIAAAEMTLDRLRAEYSRLKAEI